jgi:hypothetical protein
MHRHPAFSRTERMKVGIDFGTTRIVVAAVDRGNYPVVTFEDADGQAQDWFPPMVAVRGDERRYGFEACRMQDEDGWTVVRSIKHLLSSSGLATQIQLGHQAVPMLQLLRELAGALHTALRESSSLRLKSGEPLETLLGVPANAHSNQRFLTAEPSWRRGLVRGSPATVGSQHRARAPRARRRRRRTAPDVLVCDLAAALDASLVELDERTGCVPLMGFQRSVAMTSTKCVELALDAADIAPPGDDSPGSLFALHRRVACQGSPPEFAPHPRRFDSVVAGWPT